MAKFELKPVDVVWKLDFLGLICQDVFKLLVLLNQQSSKPNDILPYCRHEIM